MKKELDSPKKKLITQALVLWIFLVFCGTIYMRFDQSTRDAVDEIIRPAERLAVVARYGEGLSPEMRRQMLGLAAEMEDDPVALKLIRGEPPPNPGRTSLSHTYQLMEQELRESTPVVKTELVQLARDGLIRFKVTLGLLGFLVCAGLLSFVLPAHKNDRPADPSKLEPVQILGVFFAWHVAGLFAVGTLFAVLSLYLDKFVVTFVCQMVLYGFLILILRAASPNSDFKPFRRFTGSWVGKGYFLALFSVLFINFLVTQATGASPESTNPILGHFAQAPAWQVALLGLLVVFIGPFFEELLFRGWLYGGLRTKWGDGWALFISSALFALIHGDAPALPALFALGMIFGWVYRRSGSLWANILVHGFWNATTFAFLISLMP